MAATTEADGYALLQEAALRHVWMGSMRRDQVLYHGPLVFSHGEGVSLYGVDGRRYLDAMSGAWVVNVGHGRARMADAIARQAKQVAFVLHEGYTTPTTIALASRLAQLAPAGLDRMYFTCGGSEAIETALKVVRQYHVQHQNRARYKTIGRGLSYHGATYGATSVTGFDDWRSLFVPLVPGAKFAPHPHCYRCPLNRTYPGCNVACVDALERLILDEGPETVGAVIAEPISAASAVSIPPAEYWPKLRAICTRYDILLIVDEVVTGFGRTGQMFGLDHWGVVPDILVLGKGMTSGYAPLAATLVRRDIAETLDPQGLVHGFTYSGHPVSCAAALENLTILEEERLVDNAARQGHYLKEQLQHTIGDSPLVGDIRGRGLLLSIELVANRVTKQRFAPDIYIQDMTKRFLLDHGVICRTGNQIRLGPPLCIKESECDELVDVLARLVRFLEQQLVGQYQS